MIEMIIGQQSVSRRMAKWHHYVCKNEDLLVLEYMCGGSANSMHVVVFEIGMCGVCDNVARYSLVCTSP